MQLGWDVRFVSPSDCGRVLLAGEADVALVPSVEVLKNTAAFTVLPGVAFASKRRFPYLHLELNGPVTEIRTVLVADDSEPFYGLTAVVLREQYERSVSLVRHGEADSRLVFGESPAGAAKEQCLDVGLEWFEMTGTPLAWGFFAAKPGTLPDSKLSAIQDELASVLRSGQSLSEEEWKEQGGPSPSLRAGYDPEVSEGIDELAHYLFYVGVLDDIPALRLMATQN